MDQPHQQSILCPHLQLARVPFSVYLQVHIVRALHQCPSRILSSRQLSLCCPLSQVLLGPSDSWRQAAAGSYSHGANSALQRLQHASQRQAAAGGSAASATATGGGKAVAGLARLTNVVSHFSLTSSSAYRYERRVRAVSHHNLSSCDASVPHHNTMFSGNACHTASWTVLHAAVCCPVTLRHVAVCLLIAPVIFDLAALYQCAVV